MWQFRRVEIKRRGWRALVGARAMPAVAIAVTTLADERIALAQTQIYQAGQAQTQHVERARSGVDRPVASGRVVAGPSSGDGAKECEVKGPDVICARRGLIFSRCALGQKWRLGKCDGTAGMLTQGEVFNPTLKARLGPWRVPTVDELGAPMSFLAKSEDSPFNPALKYWTSTRAAMDQGYNVMHYGSKRAGLGQGKMMTRVSTSAQEQKAVLILVRSAS